MITQELVKETTGAGRPLMQPVRNQWGVALMLGMVPGVGEIGSRGVEGEGEDGCCAGG